MTYLFRTVHSSSKLSLVVEEQVTPTHTQRPENKEIGDSWCAARLDEVEQSCREPATTSHKQKSGTLMLVS